MDTVQSKAASAASRESALDYDPIGRGLTIQGFASQSEYYQNDLSLVEMAVSVWRHRAAVMGVIVGFLVLGLVFGLYRPVIFTYHSVLEIGSYNVPLASGEIGGRNLIEDSASVSSRIQKFLATSALLSYTDTYPDQSLPVVGTSSAPNSNVIEVTVSGASQYELELMGILDHINTALLVDHRGKAEDIESELLQKKEEQELLVGSLAAEIEAANSEVEILKQMELALNAESQVLEERLNELKKIAPAVGGGQGVKLLLEGKESLVAGVLYNDQWVKTLGLINELETRYVAGIVNERAVLQKSKMMLIKDLRVTEAKLESAKKLLARYGGLQRAGQMATDADVQPAAANISEAENSVNRALSITPTRVVIDPFKSHEPDSSGLPLVMLVALALGLIISCLVVVLLELVDKVKVRLGK